MTPFEQILMITLENVQKLLIDHRVGENVGSSDYDDNDYQASQFNTIYGDDAYNADMSRRPYKGDLNGSEPFYPLTMDETLDLQDIRILDYVQLGFIPIEDLEFEKYNKPSLFVENATDRSRLDSGNTTLNQVEESIPLNFRLITKQPEEYKISTTNIIVVDKVLEGLKYVLNPDDYINLSFERRGYSQPTVIRKIEFVQALNLEGFMQPYEVMEYLFKITVREQRSRSKSIS